MMENEEIINAVIAGDLVKLSACVASGHTLNFLYERNTKRLHGRGPLHIAVAKQRIDIVKYLLTHGEVDVDIDFEDRKGNTALHYAAFALREKLVTYFVLYEGGVYKQKLSKEEVEAFAETKLFLLLMAYGAKTNVKNKDDKTPLQIFDRVLDQKIDQNVSVKSLFPPCNTLN